MLGKSVQVWPLSSDWYTPESCCRRRAPGDTGPLGLVGSLGIVYRQSATIEVSAEGLVELDRVGVGRRVVGLAEDGVRQVVDVAGDVDPLVGGGVVRRGDRVGDVEHAGGGDGVGLVAAAGGVGDDRLDGRAVQAGGDRRVQLLL